MKKCSSTLCKKNLEISALIITVSLLPRKIRPQNEKVCVIELITFGDTFVQTVSKNKISVQFLKLAIHEEIILQHGQQQI